MKKVISIILVCALFSVSLISFAVFGKTDASSGSVPLAPPSDWASSDIETAKALNIMSEGKVYRYQMSITREEFCELIYNYCYNVKKEVGIAVGENPFKDTNNSNIIRLYKMGIINGKSDTEFAPNDFLTREEAATILFRLIDKVYPDWAAHQVYYVFEDEDKKIQLCAWLSIARDCPLHPQAPACYSINGDKKRFYNQPLIAQSIGISYGMQQEIRMPIAGESPMLTTLFKYLQSNGQLTMDN